MFSANYERGNRAVVIQWDSSHPDRLDLTLYLNYLDFFYRIEGESVPYSGPALPDVSSLMDVDDKTKALLVSLSEHLFTAELPEEWQQL